MRKKFIFFFIKARNSLTFKTLTKPTLGSDIPPKHLTLISLQPLNTVLKIKFLLIIQPLRRSK